MNVLIVFVVKFEPNSQMSTILKIINVERDIKLKLVVVHFCQNK